MDKCKYCGFRYTCDLHEQSEIDNCKVNQTVHNTTREQARRLKQLARNRNKHDQS